RAWITHVTVFGHSGKHEVSIIKGGSLGKSLKRDRHQSVIVGQHENKLARGLSPSKFPRISNGVMARRAHVPNSGGRKLLGDLRGAIGRTVVGYDDFKVIERLLQYRLNRIGKQLAAIERWDNDTKKRH